MDGGKPGSKMHVLSDANGLPLLVGVPAADTHDSEGLKPMVEGHQTRHDLNRRPPRITHDPSVGVWTRTVTSPTLPTGTAGTSPQPSRSLPARRGHLFFSFIAAPPWFLVACLPLRVRVRDGGTGVSRTPGVPLTRTHKQQAGGPGGAALEQEKKV